MHDVLQRTLARSGKDHAIDPRALQVLAEAFGVAPLAGVVDQQGVLDAVLGVVDRRRVVGVDHLDQVAVGGQRVVFFVDGDGAVERTMHRVPTQQAGPLDQVVLGALAHDDRAQAQAVAAAGLLDQDTRQQATDAAEAVEHDVGAFAGIAVLLTGHFGQLGLDEVLDAAAVTFCLELGDHLAQIDGSGTQLELAHRLEDRERLVNRQLGVISHAMTGETMRLHDRDHRAVDQTTAMDRGHHIVIAVELANQRDHGFRDGFTIDPFTETLVGLLSHGQYLPHVGDEKRGYIMTAPARLGNLQQSED
ncbi:hypothetical protein ALP65_04682 [Pseudomonas aeruginosa]|uniref:Uncharacterized protein n=1 Tax=Pseudomonas aeruginosa TaxID=287 RepID=A0A3M5EFU3_PSEAI|nr:hypothetical protein ALP65_04682 [Pseudomonas aeruginosa]